MDKINRIIVDGREYVLSADDRDIVKEIDSFEDGSIFVGLLKESDKDGFITYNYLDGLLKEDNVNNKAFANTEQPITVRAEWDGDEGKAPFLLIPASHKQPYMLSIPCQQFTGWKDDYTTINIQFPADKVSEYRMYRFGNFLYRANVPLTWTF